MQTRGRLDRELVLMCAEYGKRVCPGYADGTKSTFYSSNGVERDPKVQARARAAECGQALCLGLDPRAALDWGSEPRGGADLAWRGVTIDVKRTELSEAHRRLPWMPQKIPLFDKFAFDVLSLVKTEGADYFCAGWISKKRFRREKLVAREGRLDKLDAGTWFVMQETLHSMALLETFAIWKGANPQ